MIRYLKERLNERSTWMLIGVGVGAASALQEPWSYVSAVVGVLAALVKDDTIVKP